MHNKTIANAIEGDNIKMPGQSLSGYFRAYHVKTAIAALDNQGNPMEEENVDSVIEYPVCPFSTLHEFKEMTANALGIPAQVLEASRTGAGLVRLSYKGDENGNITESPAYQWSVYFLLRRPADEDEVKNALNGDKGDWIAENADSPEDSPSYECNYLHELGEEVAAECGCDMVEDADTTGDGVVCFMLNVRYRLLGIASHAEIDALLA